MSAQQPVLAIESIVKEYARRGRGEARESAFRAVDDVTLEVSTGETLGIVGESGSGKSTTARIMARLIDPTSGTVRLDGQDVTNASGAALRPLRRAVGFVFQDPYSSLNPRHEVERIITAPLRYQGIRKKRPHREIARDLMERVGLNPDHANRLPHQFSGGQAQRIGIARALAVEPRLVVCDEAVSALDVSVQAQIIELLHDLQRDLGLGYVFIAHDLAVVRLVADRVAVMRQGQLVETGDRDALFGAPQHEYTRALLDAVPRIDPAWEARRMAKEAAHDGQG